MATLVVETGYHSLKFGYVNGDEVRVWKESTETVAAETGCDFSKYA